jgi:hypothetical protein
LTRLNHLDLLESLLFDHREVASGTRSDPPKFNNHMKSDENNEKEASDELLDAHVAPPSAYRRSSTCTLPVSYIVERLFSKAKIVLSDLRNRMTPRHKMLSMLLLASESAHLE